MLIKLEWLGYRTMKNCDSMLSRFHLIPERDGQTDRQTDGPTELLYRYRASVCWRAIKIVFGHNSAADCPISAKFCARKQLFSQNFSNGADTRVPRNVFYVFLMQFGLRQAAPFMSSRIHLFDIIYHVAAVIRMHLLTVTDWTKW